MRIPVRIAITATMAAASTLLLTPPADAATGRIDLLSPHGIASLVNPRPGCYARQISFSEVANRTNVDVTVYKNAACSGDPLVVRRGSTTPVGDRYSIRVP